MPSTGKGLRYPQGSDSPNIPQYFQNLAGDVDGLLFTNGGTFGAAAGSAPSAGTPLIVKTYYAAVGLSAEGDGTVIFPGGAFPHGLLGVWLNHITIGAAPSNDLEFVPWQTSAILSSVNVRCYSPNGTTFGGTGVPLCLIAVGW